VRGSTLPDWDTEDASVRPSPRWLRAGVTLSFTGATLDATVSLPALYRCAAVGIGALGKRLVDG
jgi:hypothetical protein